MYWQKHGKGPKYRGMYLHDGSGERNFVLTRLMRNGKVHAVTCESHEMAKHAGWQKEVKNGTS